MSNTLAPYTIPNLKIHKNGKQQLIGVKKIKWFTTPMRTILVSKEGEYQNIIYTPFNPGSRSHIIKWLHDDLSFEFPFYTPSGSPKVDPDSLEGLEHSSGVMMRKYLQAVKDQGMTGSETNSGWLRHYNENTHSIHHKVDLIGAVTHRATHCLPLDYLVKTPEGNKKHSEIKSGDLVYGYDVSLKRKVLSKVQEVNVYNDTGTGVLSNSETSFTCTKDHKWVTDQGLKRACDISPEDTIILKE